MYEIRSSSSTSFPTIASWYAQDFASWRYSEQELMSWWRFCNCRFKWVIRDFDYEAKRVAKEFHTCRDVFSPYTVDRTLFDKVAFSQLRRYWSFLFQIVNSGFMMSSPLEFLTSLVGHVSIPSTMPNKSWLRRTGRNWETHNK